MDPVNAMTMNALFWNLVSGWKNPQTSVISCLLVWTANPHSLCIDDASPHSSTSSLQPLNPVMSHNNNDNNGELHAGVCAAEDIEPNRFTRANILLLCYYAEDYGQPTSHFHLLLVVFGFSFYCLFVYSVQVLCGNRLSSFWLISSATYRPGIWTTACWVVYSGSFGCKYSWNDAMEDRGKKIVLVRVDMA